MKLLRLAAVSTLLGGGIIPTQGAALLVQGFLEGSANELVLRGDTMDYYKFAVTTEGTVRIEAQRTGMLYLLASFIGVTDEFGFLGNPYRLDTGIPCVTPFCLGDPTVVLERALPIGEYVLAATAGGRTSYDVFDGYVAVNREGGGFAQAPYGYTITGDVEGLEYWDGHLDGTFTVTQIPEPGASALAGFCAVLLLCHRTAKPGNDARRAGINAAKPGNDARKPGNSATKPGNDSRRPGNDLPELDAPASSPARQHLSCSSPGGRL